MIEKLNPKDFHLHYSTLFLKEGKNISLIKKRKSRIISKDAEKILEDINKVKKQLTGFNFLLLTNAPICSKSTAILAENNIEIKFETEANLAKLISFYA